VLLELYVTCEIMIDARTKSAVAASAETRSAFRRSKGATTRSGAVASHSVYLARASHVRERDLAHAHTQRVESALADTWRKRSAFTGRVGRLSSALHILYKYESYIRFASIII
jgi:hypothetical protein